MREDRLVRWRRWLGRKGIGLGLRIVDAETRREFLRQPDVPSFAATYARMKARGISPDTVVDVGANRGDWTREFHSFFPEARILVVEPQRGLQERLAAVCRELGEKVTRAHCLLGAAPQAAVPFQILDDHAGGSGSSVFPEHSDVPRHTELLPQTTLDALLKGLNVPPPDFIKVDTQGYELEVLKGAGASLASTQWVLLEVSTWPFNAGAPLLPEVVAWMESAGFVTWDVCGIQRLPDGTLCHLDLLFLRASSPHRALGRVRFNP